MFRDVRFNRLKCSLKCNHGYVSTDEYKMSASCNCNRHGLCRWNYPSSCVRVNEIAGMCDAPYHVIGEYTCTGFMHGDQCELRCDKGFETEQHGIRQCICSTGGGCDWLGQAGTCTRKFELDILADFETTSLLSANQCSVLPEMNIGQWVCSNDGKSCNLRYVNKHKTFDNIISF